MITNRGRVTNQDYLDAAKMLGVDIVKGPIEPGDMYLAGRNTGIKLLVCMSVHKKAWIVPTTIACSYNTWECRKVVDSCEKWLTDVKG